MAVPAAAQPRGNTRLRVAVAAGVAVLLVALVLRLLFGGGGDDGVDELAVPVTVDPATVTTEPDVPAPPPETVEVFTNKNPFTPLVDLTPTASSEETPPASTGGTTAPSEGTNTGTPTPVSVPPGTSAPTGATGPPPSQRVTLVDISSGAGDPTRATIQVNDNLYEVAEGEEFAGSYRVVSLSDSEGCAQLLYGDDRFRVCEGEELLK